MKRSLHTVGRRWSACAFIVQLSSAAQSCASVKNFLGQQEGTSHPQASLKSVQRNSPTSPEGIPGGQRALSVTDPHALQLIAHPGLLYPLWVLVDHARPQEEICSRF
jgi:hypothetical protein